MKDSAPADASEAQASDAAAGRGSASKGGTRPDRGSGLAAILAQRLQGSLLPGEGEVEREEIAAAARFVLEVAARRQPGQSALGIETVAGGEARGRFMRIAVVNEDMPFLVDSVAAAITAHGLAIDRLLHPVVKVERDGEHRIVALPEAAGDGVRI